MQVSAILEIKDVQRACDCCPNAHSIVTLFVHKGELPQDKTIHLYAQCSVRYHPSENVWLLYAENIESHLAIIGVEKSVNEHDTFELRLESDFTDSVIGSTWFAVYV